MAEEEEVKLKPKQKPHYVDNKKFLVAMTEYRELRIKAEEENKKRPQVTNYIGECYLKIANHLSYRPNFINYTYRDDMISDGIENCLQYMDNFDPAKSKNPFAYFTQIIYYAFIRRIQKEKKQQQVKQKMIANFGEEQMMDQLDGDDTQYQSQMLDFLRRNSREETEADKKKEVK
jgi:DNA-directed RNA polymerase specialized sigma subunit